MTTQVADRVVETTTTTGTGTLALDGAKAGYRSFADAVTAGDFADGDTVYYYCTDGTDWEVGSGVFTVATLTLTRATIARSSNAGNAVNWAAGSKDVVCNMPAAELQKLIDNSFGPTTITAGTLTTDVKTLDISATHNAAGVAFTGVKANFTDTASANGTNYVDWQLGGVSHYKFNKQYSHVFKAISTNSNYDAKFAYVGAATALQIMAGSLSNVGTQVAYDSIQMRGVNSLGWSSSATTVGTADTLLYRDAAGAIGQRNGTNAQIYSNYGHYVSTTSYSRVSIRHAVTTLASVSGASVTATGLIPAKAKMLGVNTKVMVALGTGSGTTGYAVGTAGDPNLWGDVVGTATTVASGQGDATADPVLAWSAAAQDVVITAAGGNFDGTGSILIDVAYTMTEAD